MQSGPSKHKAYLIPAIYIIVKDNQGKILLLERKNTGYCDGQLTLPSGHIEQGESILDSAVRELAEETSLIAKASDLKLVHVMQRKVDENVSYIDFIVETTHWSGTAINAEPEKSAQVMWVSESNLPSNTIDHVVKVIEYVQAGIQISDW